MDKLKRALGSQPVEETQSEENLFTEVLELIEFYIRLISMFSTIGDEQSTTETPTHV